MGLPLELVDLAALRAVSSSDELQPISQGQRGIREVARTWSGSNDLGHWSAT